MPNTSLERLVQKIKNKEFDGYQEIINSYGNAYFTFCFYLSLKIDRLARDLFKASIKRAMKSPDSLTESVEMWLHEHLFKEWKVFARSHNNLKEQNSGYHFDWTRAVGRQSEDALELLNPLERIIFLYRFVNGFSVTQIKKITGNTEKNITDTFAQAIRKVSAL